MLTWERENSHRRQWMKKAGVALLALCLMTPLMMTAAWGDSVTDEQYEQQEKTKQEQTKQEQQTKREQRLLAIQTGSSKATVNGESLGIAKPVLHQGAVMVPLGVFKQAFGSEIRLEGNNRIRILQGPHNIVLVMDSKTAWIDGQKVELPVAPTMISDTLMVPLRQVASGMGAKLSTSGSGAYTVSLNVVVKEQTDSSGLEGPGSSRIGNSYYTWSINYPSWMMIIQGASDESASYFTDPTGRYYLEVHALDQTVPLNVEDLLEIVISDVKESRETILHREAVSSAAVAYARAVTRDMDGLLWETRAYYANDRVYMLYFSDANAEHYTDMNTHAAFLNSFRTSFPAADSHVKDLSSVVDGLMDVGNDEYGVYLSVPADWNMNDEEMMYFKQKEGILAVTVTSVPKGAKSGITSWVDEIKKWYAESFVEDAYKMTGQSPIEISGVEGQLLELQYNSGNGWIYAYQILIEHNGYRYHIEYAYPERIEDGAGLWEKMLDSIDIDYDRVPDQFGDLGEDNTLVDKTKMSTKSSSAYRYHIDIPLYWTPISDRFEQSDIQYSFMGGNFEIMARWNSPADRIIQEMKRYYTEANASNSKLKLLSVENITFAGASAVSFTTHQEKDGVGFTTREIVFENNGITYMIVAELNDANATKEQTDVIERTLASFGLTK